MPLSSSNRTDKYVLMTSSNINIVYILLLKNDLNLFSSVPNHIWDDFEMSVKMATYTTVFIISEFQGVPSQNVNMTTYARPQVLPYVSKAAIVAPQFLKILENITRIPYQLEKLDLIAVPDITFGAMENWGLVTFV